MTTGSDNDSKEQNDKNKKIAASTTSLPEIPSNSSTFCLRVRNPFAFTATQSTYSVSGAPPRRVPPTAHQVLQRELSGDLIKRIHIVDPKDMESMLKGNNNNNESSSNEVVYFQCDFTDVALIKDKLWKYDLKEL